MTECNCKLRTWGIRHWHKFWLRQVIATNVDPQQMGWLLRTEVANDGWLEALWSQRLLMSAAWTRQVGQSRRKRISPTRPSFVRTFATGVSSSSKGRKFIRALVAITLWDCWLLGGSLLICTWGCQTYSAHTYNWMGAITPHNLCILMPHATTAKYHDQR